MSQEESVPKRRKVKRSEVPVSFLPIGNPAAKTAYILGIASLVPGLGILFGLPAFGFGVAGRRAALKDEDRRGFGHSFVARIAGPVCFVCHTLGAICIYRAVTG